MKILQVVPMPEIKPHLVALVVLLSSVCLLSARGDEKKSKEFSSKAGRFTVVFPGVPTEKTENVGDSESHAFQVTLDAFEYEVAYSDWPYKVKVAPETRLKNIVKGFIKFYGEGNLLGSKKIKLGDHPGHEIELAAGKEVCRGRFYINIFSQRCYYISVVGPSKKAVHSKAAEAFLYSFKLIDPPK